MGPTPPFIEVVSPCRCEPLWAGCCGGGGGGGGGVRCFVGVNLSSSQPLYLFGMRLSSFIECGGG